MSAKGSRKIKVGDMVKWENRFGHSFIGIVLSRKGALCHIKWLIDDDAIVDYVYCSDLEKLS